MSKALVLGAAGLALLFCVAPPTQPGPSTAQARPKVLYLTQSAGFKHAVLPLSEQILTEIGRASGAFDATVTQDSAQINAANLATYDAVVFYTTGELPMDDAQKQALMAFVKGGKGFVGVHSATDTFYQWPEYGELIGGFFNDHPWHQEVTIRVEDTTSPATRHLPPQFALNEEIYQFRDWSRDKVHVLLSLDPTSVDLTGPKVKRTDKDFALAWTREFEKGRVFYTALGHEPAVWQDVRFQQHLLGGIRWAMGK
jgi:type 1 glutamine amidotransferase